MKKFFAKLIGWENPTWSEESYDALRKSKDLQNDHDARRAREEANRNRELAEERRQASLRNMPEEERLARLKEDLKTTVETPDEAA